MKLSDAVQDVIRLGDKSSEYWDRELPKHHPNYPLIRAEESIVPPPPEDAEIQSLLKNLPEDQLYAIILLTYVGRGDFNADDLPHAYQTMKETFPSRDLAVAQMSGHKAIAEYLKDAMEEIQKRRIDLDNLKFARTAAMS